MAIEIGKYPCLKDEWYQIECHHCHSQIAFQENDVVHEIYHWFYLICPVCHKMIPTGEEPEIWAKLEGESDGNQSD